MEERMGETAGESMKMGMEKAMSENTAVSRGNPRRKEESDAKRKPVIGQWELGIRRRGRRGQTVSEPATMRRGAGEGMGGRVFRGTSPVTQRITKRKIGNAAVNRGFAEEIVWRVKANHTCTRVSETLCLRG